MGDLLSELTPEQRESLRTATVIDRYRPLGSRYYFAKMAPQNSRGAMDNYSLPRPLLEALRPDIAAALPVEMSDPVRLTQERSELTGYARAAAAQNQSDRNREVWSWLWETGGPGAAVVLAGMSFVGLPVVVALIAKSLIAGDYATVATDTVAAAKQAGDSLFQSVVSGASEAAGALGGGLAGLGIVALVVGAVAMARTSN